MAPPNGSGCDTRPYQKFEACVNKIENQHEARLDDISKNESYKVIYTKHQHNRAFNYQTSQDREANRCFEEKRNTVSQDDSYSGGKSIKQTNGYRENRRSQLYKPIRSKEHAVYNKLIKEDRELKRAMPGNHGTILFYKSEIPHPESRESETAVAERADEEIATELQPQNPTHLDLTIDGPSQIETEEDGKGVSETEECWNRSNARELQDECESPELLSLQQRNYRTHHAVQASLSLLHPLKEEGPEALQHAGATSKRYEQDESPRTPPGFEIAVHSRTDDDKIPTISEYREDVGVLQTSPVQRQVLTENEAESSPLEEQKNERSYDDSQIQDLPSQPLYQDLNSNPVPADVKYSAEKNAPKGPALFRQTTTSKTHAKQVNSDLTSISGNTQEAGAATFQRSEQSDNNINTLLARSTKGFSQRVVRDNQVIESATIPSQADFRSLKPDRDGSPPQIPLVRVQPQRDKNSPSSSVPKAPSLVQIPANVSPSFPIVKQTHCQNQTSRGRVPPLKIIVAAKFVRITKNLYRASENVLKRTSLKRPEYGSEHEYDAGITCRRTKGGGSEDSVLKRRQWALEVPKDAGKDSMASIHRKIQPGFVAGLASAAESQSETTPVGEEKNSSLKCEFVIRIIHENSQDRYQQSYQWNRKITGQEPGASYFIRAAGISESQVQFRVNLLQKDFDSFFPSYRRWRYGKGAAKSVEFYSVSKGKTGVFQKICSIDVRGKNRDQCHVLESKIQEAHQFVEVMQPRPGIISDVASDPPGQQSVYIPPGDNRKEAYRLSTFESFPKQTPINVPSLAKNGFFYLGFYDRVKCYSCGRTVEKWAPGDDPSDKRWHKEECLLARGVVNDNIPIGGRFSSVLFSGSSSGASVSSAPQPMEVGQSHTQNFNGQIPRGIDVTDLTRSGGTYQMLPNSTFVIGPTSVQTHQAPLPVRQPANNPQAARNPPRQWRMANVISADHKRHLTNLYLNRELDRLASFGRWPTGRPNVAPVELARAGFFYLGDMDRTQCYSCGGVLRNWSADDDAMVEHRTHFPSCRIIAGVERRNVPVPQQAETPMELAEKFPCRFPMNPHMRSEQSRLATFDRRWPADRTRAQPQEIAEAGFFFLGERDRVKCWYCNGGLQNWEYDDVPWIEHAKWFPNCQFLLAKQGQLFVYRYLSLSPHLPRPIIGRQDGASVDPSTATPHSGQASRSQDVAPAPVSRVQAPSPPPAIIDPQEELRKRRERVEKDLKENDMVKVVLAMGYAEDLVRRTLLEKLETGRAHDADNIFEGTAALLDAVMEKEAELERETEEEQATSIKFPTMSSNYSALTLGSMDTSPSGPPSGIHQVSGFDDDDEDRDLYSSIAEGPSAGAVGGATSGPASFANETKLQHIWKDLPEDQESMKEFIEQKKEERLCKICFDKPADMVFIPCSHMCCCMSCTEAIRHCPICRKKIEKAIKTYVK